MLLRKADLPTHSLVLAVIHPSEQGPNERKMPSPPAYPLGPRVQVHLPHDGASIVPPLKQGSQANANKHSRALDIRPERPAPCFS